MTSKVNSFDDKVKLPVTETVSRFYQQPQQNRKAIRILTVAVYVLCVSLAAIMLSLYYIFIWDPTVKPFMPKVTNCEKIIIPEQIAIRLTNYTEISADQFYKNILQHYQKIQRKNSRRINSYVMTSSSLKRSNKIIENQSLTVGTTSTAAAAAGTAATAPTSIPASASTSNNTSKLEFDDPSYKSTIKSVPTDITSAMNSDSPPRTAITTVATTKIPTSPKLIKNHMSRNHFNNNNNNDFDNNENENDNLLLVEQPISSSGLKMNNLIKRIPHPAKRHKLSEYFIKSIKMHNSRRMNNDDEDYSDSNEFDNDNDGDANDDDDNDDNMKNINIDEASGDYGYDDRNIRYNKYKNNKFIDIS